MIVTSHRTRRPSATLIGSIAVSLLLAGAPVIAAQLYQWQDENGVVHYTDKPPKGRNAKQVSVKAPPTSGTDATETVTPDAAAKSADAKRCETERQRLQVLQSNMTVRMRSEDGTVRELTPEEMQEEIGFSQAAIERYCDSET